MPRSTGGSSSGKISLGRASEGSDLWGAPNFRGCKYCRRARTHPNPFEAVTGKPHLQFRSERHQECLPCTGKLWKSNPELVTTEDRSKFAKKLSENEAEYSTHMEAVGLYEQQQLQSLQKRRKLGQAVSDKDVEAPHQQEAVALNSTAGLELRTSLGVLWPLSTFEKTFGKKAAPGEITKVKQDGQELTGVLLPRSAGMDVGCTEMFDVKTAFANRTRQAASSDNAFSSDEVGSTWSKVGRVMIW